MAGLAAPDQLEGIDRGHVDQQLLRTLRQLCVRPHLSGFGFAPLGTPPPSGLSLQPTDFAAWLEKTPGVGAGWKIYDLNVLGVWLVETYRGQFAQQINAKGIDGLIALLADRNKANSAKKG